MRILLFGATGTLGSRIAAELTERGERVTSASRTGHSPSPDIPAVTVDPTDSDSVAAAAEGYDAIASAVHIDPDNVTAVTQGLLDGARKAGVRRIAFVGGAGSLKVPDGGDLVDTPTFPAEWKPIGLAHRDELNLIRPVTDLDWSYLSPAAAIAPGERTGKFRMGGDDLIVGDDGNSFVSAEDYAVAFADELEQGNAIRRRITVGY
ncbi:MAG: NAD(P)H-binding protein [Hamadaea sp.]|nr:NAD(P)H-binding protein [Hamadaea sp.]NUT07155.1 NAD(P)H-binding protein [Hamadaea sp.]